MDEPSVIDHVVRAGQQLVRVPAAQLVLCGIVLALAFPSSSSGAIGLAVIAGGVGVAIASWWPRRPDSLRSPPPEAATTVVLVVIVIAGATVFWDTLTVSPDWQMGDWGPQHAVLRGVMPSLPGLDVPVWNHAVSTGDAPLELYPALAYLVTGHLALLLGLEGDLSLALMIVAVLVHIAIAVATAALAIRVAPRPLALLVGMLALVDTGAVAHGGTVGLFRWGLLHSAMSLAFALVAALGVVAALTRPRLSASIAIWIGTALACATHPAGLIGAAAAIIALAAVALLATDVPARRPLFAIVHLLLGIALGAAVWMPLAERILAYGQHFPNGLRSPEQLLEDLLAAPSPHTAYAMIAYAGYFGILAGLWSRRARVVFVSATALVLLVGLCDAPYTAFDLAPGQGGARLGTERLAQLARPFVAASAAYGISIFVGAARAAWRGASTRRRLIAAALLGVLCGAVIRVVPAMWASMSMRASSEARVIAPDARGRAELTRWARAAAAQLGPDRWARAAFEQDTHEHFHLTAQTGLPTFHLAPQPDLLLRERIEDLSEASLARFNVRWAIAIDRSPTVGDPQTEQVFGSYRVREIRSWDGKLARIERGTGQVKVLRLDDRAVEIEVTDTTEPVLVALGTGFYPRWRAHHASGVAEPVYAMPSVPGGKLHVVAAWVAPGRTTFTVDGPLPSDHAGRWWSIVAAILCVAAIVVWTAPPLRDRVLRRVARWRRKLPAFTTRALRIGVPALCVALLIRGCAEDHAVTRALELGTGIRSTVSVEARYLDGEWQTCEHSWLEGSYHCPGLVYASDGMASLLNDAAPSWGFNTPAIVASAEAPGVELRVRLHARLAGTYWTAVSDDKVALSVDGEADREVGREVLVYADEGEREVTIQTELPLKSWSFTFVREDTIIPPRPFLVEPPPSPPAIVSAIR
ncbi:MAG: hypothetical protein AB7L28_12625 [Kofleriaceae bacterium]